MPGSQLLLQTQLDGKYIPSISLNHTLEGINSNLIQTDRSDTISGVTSACCESAERHTGCLFASSNGQVNLPLPDRDEQSAYLFNIY
jgi:hypothetical protein